MHEVMFNPYALRTSPLSVRARDSRWSLKPSIPPRGSDSRVRGPWSGLGLGSDYGGVGLGLGSDYGGGGLGPDSDYGRGRTTQSGPRSGLVFANNLENIVKLTKINPKF